MRTLGIDFGERRIGLAISDPEGRVAVPLTTFERTSDRQAVGRIAAIVRAEGVEALVLGEPRNVDGSRGQAVERVHRFAAKLREKTALPVEFVAETLTSVEARQRLAVAGVDLRRRPEKIDAVAAQILLQEALDRARETVGEPS
jgi:putative Holliday junction resolvase